MLAECRGDGRTYYGENAECDLTRACNWVRLHVLTQLDHRTALMRRKLADDIIKFVGRGS
jgi:hypothetical protein